MARLACLLALTGFFLESASAAPPNIVLILADDIGYGDLGCYGQKKIRTPHIDRLASQGIRFTQVYAGSTVCAPSRCCLMTGLHTGHARIRGNANVSLQASDVTVASLLKKHGYTTGLVGKWGLGEPGTAGVPNSQGFDHFFGYLNQHHAHNYYPDYLWRNMERVKIEGNKLSKVDNVSEITGTYAPDLFLEDALNFIANNRDKPFFLFFSSTLPHANNERGRSQGNGMEIPSDEPYTSEPWPAPQRNHAAMITRLDTDVGKILAKLDELKLSENTVVFFSSDNGPHKEGGADPKFFGSSGPLRGFKRSLTDGGIRVPMIVRWTGKIQPKVSDHVWAFWDFLPTAMQLAGHEPEIPADIDGVSVAPGFFGVGGPAWHDFLYWEFHERGFAQAVRMGPYKAIRPKVNAPLELYHVERDPAESENLAKSEPDVVRKIEDYLRNARTDSKDFPVKP